MNPNPFAPDLKNLPASLPVFPLSGVLLLPFGNLPLNIFEPRYLAMVDDALAGDRLIGMIQPREAKSEILADDTPLFKTGCAGKITEFSETADGRYMVKLSGICRFDIESEWPVNRGYRRIKPNWSPYTHDITSGACEGLDRVKLQSLLRRYFDNEGMTCDWGAVENAPDGKLITCLSMVCPFDPTEKQALLEAGCSTTRAKMFMTMLEMAVCDARGCKSAH